MLFSYFDALSGEPIFVRGVGHVESPKLRKLVSSAGISQTTYNLFLNLLSWDKEQFLKYCKIMKYRSVDKLNNEIFNIFDVVTLLKQTRELYSEMLSFFISEQVVWNEKNRCFVMQRGDPQDDGEIVGIIDRENFEDVRKIILQANYIGLEKDTSAAPEYASEKAKELWEQAQRHLKNQAKKPPSDAKPEYRLDNIISKVCVVHPSYNLLNVYDLTVFQLYDAFFQVGYMKMSELNERIFSNHGGDKFNFEDWLKPILKNM